MRLNTVICEIISELVFCFVIFLFIVLPILSVIALTCFITYIYGVEGGVIILIVGLIILILYYYWLKSGRKK